MLGLLVVNDKTLGFYWVLTKMTSVSVTGESENSVAGNQDSREKMVGLYRQALKYFKGKEPESCVII